MSSKPVKPIKKPKPKGYKAGRTTAKRVRAKTDHAGRAWHERLDELFAEAVARDP